VIYRHTDSIAGWSRPEMLLLLGTSLLIQRLLMGFFWSGLYDLGRNIRNGHLDFFLAQPGSVMFMVSTRKLDPDGLVNSVVALGLVVYAAGELGLRPSPGQLALYALLVGCGLVVHYSVLMLSTASVFWLTREAFRGAAEVIFVWLLPVVVVSNAPARVLLHGFEPAWALGLAGFAALWLGLAVIVFHRGLRRYASASS
jgi:ABC-2 type transport system permease protein